MNEYNIFSIIALNEITTLQKTTKDFLARNLVRKKFFKKEVISYPGKICNEIYLIKKGLVQAYFELNDEKITNWVSVDEEIFTSVTSFFSNQPCQEFIQCLEDTYVEALNYEALREALNRFPDFANVYHKLLEKYYCGAEIRAMITRIPGAKERWEYFTHTYHPKIIERTPNHIIASLLNLRPETLSRLKKTRKINESLAFSNGD